MRFFIPLVLLWICYLPSISNASTYTVNTRTLNVRSGPSIEHKVIDQLKQSDVVEVKETYNDWVKIGYGDNKEGFVSIKYLLRENQVFGLSQSHIIAGSVILIILLAIFLALRRGNENKPKANHLPQSNIIITKSTKSVGIAILLAVIFPYLGILYASLKTFLWSFLSLIAFWAIIFYIAYADYRDGGDAGDSFLILGGFFTYLHYFISIILAGISANRYNKKLYKQA